MSWKQVLKSACSLLKSFLVPPGSCCLLWSSWPYKTTFWPFALGLFPKQGLSTFMSGSFPLPKSCHQFWYFPLCWGSMKLNFSGHNCCPQCSVEQSGLSSVERSWEQRHWPASHCPPQESIRDHSTPLSLSITVSKHTRDWLKENKYDKRDEDPLQEYTSESNVKYSW